MHSERNRHFLMSLKRTDISTNGLSYQNYADILTPYVSSYLQGEIKNMDYVKVLKQMDQEKYCLKDK